MAVDSNHFLRVLGDLSEVDKFEVVDFDFTAGTGTFRILPRDPNALTADEINVIRSGKKILAIKKIRERTGLGLADAKHIVDQWVASNP